MALIPPGRREEIRGLMDPVGQAVSGFFRGQLLVALFVGVASSIGLWPSGCRSGCWWGWSPGCSTWSRWSARSSAAAWR